MASEADLGAAPVFCSGSKPRHDWRRNILDYKSAFGGSFVFPGRENEDRCVTWVVCGSELYASEILANFDNKRFRINLETRIADVAATRNTGVLFLGTSGGTVCRLDFRRRGHRGPAELSEGITIPRDCNVVHIAVVNDYEAVVALSNSTLIKTNFEKGRLRQESIDDGSSVVSRLYSSISSYLPVSKSQRYHILALERGNGSDVVSICSDGVMRVWGTKGEGQAGFREIVYAHPPLNHQDAIKMAIIKRTGKSLVLCYNHPNRDRVQFIAYQLRRNTGTEKYILQWKTEAKSRSTRTTLIDFHYSGDLWTMERFRVGSVQFGPSVRIRVCRKANPHVWEDVISMDEKRKIWVLEDDDFDGETTRDNERYFLNRVFQTGRFSRNTLSRALEEYGDAGALTGKGKTMRDIQLAVLTLIREEIRKQDKKRGDMIPATAGSTTQVDGAKTSRVFWIDFVRRCTSIGHSKSRYCGLGPFFHRLRTIPSKSCPLVIKCIHKPLGVSSSLLVSDAIFTPETSMDDTNLAELDAFELLIAHPNRSPLLLSSDIGPGVERKHLSDVGNLMKVVRMTCGVLEGLSRKVTDGKLAKRIQFVLGFSQEFDAEGQADREILNLHQEWIHALITSRMPRESKTRLENVEKMIQQLFMPTSANPNPDYSKVFENAIELLACSRSAVTGLELKEDIGSRLYPNLQISKTPPTIIHAIAANTSDYIARRFRGLQQMLIFTTFIKQSACIRQKRHSKLIKYIADRGTRKVMRLVLHYRRADWVRRQRSKGLSAFFLGHLAAEQEKSIENKIEDVALVDFSSQPSSSRANTQFSSTSNIHAESDKPLIIDIVQDYLCKVEEAKEEKKSSEVGSRSSALSVAGGLDRISTVIIRRYFLGGTETSSMQGELAQFEVDLVLVNHKHWTHLYDIQSFSRAPEPSSSIENRLFSDYLRARGILHAYRASGSKEVLAKAKHYFSRAAALFAGSEDGERTRAEEEVIRMCKEDPLRLHDTRLAQAGARDIVVYFHWVARCFESANVSAALDFAKSCLSYSNKPEIESILWTTVFNYSMELHRLDEAYIACTSIDDPKDAINCLQVFVSALADRKEIGRLCSYPWIGKRSQVLEVLWLKARCSTSASLGRDNQDSNFYYMLYAYLVHCNDYQGAAKYMYMYARHLKNVTDPTKIHNLKEQADALAAAISSLSMCEHAWLPVTEDDMSSSGAVSSKNKRKRGGSGAGSDEEAEARDADVKDIMEMEPLDASSAENKDSVLKIPKIALHTIQDLRCEYSILCAHIEYLESTGKSLGTQQLSASEVVTMIAEGGLIETAISVAQLHSIDLKDIFQTLTRKCVDLQTIGHEIEISLALNGVYKTSGPKLSKYENQEMTGEAWKILETLLLEHDTIDTNFDHRRTVARIILDQKLIKLPEWLMQMLVSGPGYFGDDEGVGDHGFASKDANVTSVLRLMTKLCMFEEAGEVAIRYLNAIAKSKRRDVWVPQQVIRDILVGMNEFSEESNEAADSHGINPHLSTLRKDLIQALQMVKGTGTAGPGTGAGTGASEAFEGAPSAGLGLIGHEKASIGAGPGLSSFSGFGSGDDFANKGLGASVGPFGAGSEDSGAFGSFGTFEEDGKRSKQAGGVAIGGETMMEDENKGALFSSSSGGMSFVDDYHSSSFAFDESKKVSSNSESFSFGESNVGTSHSESFGFGATTQTDPFPSNKNQSSEFGLGEQDKDQPSSSGFGFGIDTDGNGGLGFEAGKSVGGFEAAAEADGFGNSIFGTKSSELKKPASAPEEGEETKDSAMTTGSEQEVEADQGYMPKFTITDQQESSTGGFSFGGDKHKSDFGASQSGFGFGENSEESAIQSNFGGSEGEFNFGADKGANVGFGVFSAAPAPETGPQEEGKATESKVRETNPAKSTEAKATEVETRDKQDDKGTGFGYLAPKNDAKNTSSKACGTGKPDAENMFEPQSGLDGAPADGFGKAKEDSDDEGFAHLATNDGSWECEVCLVQNNASATSCKACGANKAEEEGFAHLAPQEGSWECEACLVQNEASVTSCKSCGADNPVGSSQEDQGFAHLAPKEGVWECGTCMVQNDAADSSCKACGTAKTGGAVEENMFASSSGEASAFSAGGAEEASKDQPTAAGFSFGGSSEFNFGGENKETASSSNDQGNTASGFSFSGAHDSTDSGGFSFAGGQDSGGFSFAGGSEESTGFGFGGSTNESDSKNDSGGFSFGDDKVSTGFGFGGNKYEGGAKDDDGGSDPPKSTETPTALPVVSAVPEAKTLEEAKKEAQQEEDNGSASLMPKSCNTGKAGSSNIFATPQEDSRENQKSSGFGFAGADSGGSEASKEAEAAKPNQESSGFGLSGGFGSGGFRESGSFGGNQNFGGSGSSFKFGVQGEDKAPGCSEGKSQPEAEPGPQEPTKEEDSEDNPFARFIPKEGSWECNQCLVENGPDKTVCAACGAGKPGSDPFGSGSTGESTSDTPATGQDSGGFKFGASNQESVGQNKAGNSGESAAFSFAGQESGGFSFRGVSEENKGENTTESSGFSLGGQESSGFSFGGGIGASSGFGSFDTAQPEGSGANFEGFSGAETNFGEGFSASGSGFSEGFSGSGGTQGSGLGEENKDDSNENSSSGPFSGSFTSPEESSSFGSGSGRSFEFSAGGNFHLEKKTKEDEPG